MADQRKTKLQSDVAETPIADVFEGRHPSPSEKQWAESTLAPALANAYAKLTGVRVRALPFFPGATMGGL